VSPLHAMFALLFAALVACLAAIAFMQARRPR
jgi:hypothetical protein